MKGKIIDLLQARQREPLQALKSHQIGRSFLCLKATCRQTINRAFNFTLLFWLLTILTIECLDYTNGKMSELYTSDKMSYLHRRQNAWKSRMPKFPNYNIDKITKLYQRRTALPTPMARCLTTPTKCLTTPVAKYLNNANHTVFQQHLLPAKQ